MTNTNCLEGVRCPKCGHEDDFHIEAMVRLHVIDSGTEDLGGGHFWDDDSDRMCGNRTATSKGCGANSRSKTRPAKAVQHERRQTSSVVHRPIRHRAQIFRALLPCEFPIRSPKAPNQDRADCDFRFRHKLLVGPINCVDALEFV
jgi:hypothetical protein